MGCRILYDASNDIAALYCSVTDIAFGPVFYDDDEHDADERAEAFCRWLKTDARKFDDEALAEKYSEWRKQEAHQWMAEDNGADTETA